MENLRQYYYLTKPGIVRGNLLTAAAGFVVASGRQIDLGLLIITLFSIALIIGSACVVNNYIDRDIDQKMQRTKKRALVSGKITPQKALPYSLILAAIGFTVLSLWTNWVTVLVGLVGYIDYVAIYTYSKRHTWHATILGSVAGSASVVAGYTAVTGQIDSAAIILFLILTFWQMPHFYAISLRQFKDYRAAQIPVLPAVHGVQATKAQIVAYTVGFIVAVVGLYVGGYSGPVYLVIMGLLAFGWLVVEVRYWRQLDTKKWATKVFLYSLVLLPAFLIATLADAWLVS